MPRGSRRQGYAGANGQIPEAFIACPVRTNVKSLPKEQEIKAYKLGKKRWSYNQCAVHVQNPETLQQFDVLDCMQYGPCTLTDKEQESGVTYQVRLETGMRVRINVFAVYDCPEEHKDLSGKPYYLWPCITRAACPKGHCEGSILRTIQRFGKLGRRSGAVSEGSENVMKNAKYMFISIDEAGSHVGMRHFRMVMGMYTMGDNQLIASAISSPIRVLANNDVPSGAAYIPFTLQPSSSWEGWKADMQARLPESIQMSGLDTDRHTSLSSLSTGRRSAAALKLDPDSCGPPSIPEMLKQHAAEWSLDGDLGAERLQSAMSHRGGYNITANAGAVGMPESTENITHLRIPESITPLHHPDEDSISFQHTCTPVYGLNMIPNTGPYSPGLSSLSANDIVYSNGSPNISALATISPYVRFPPPHQIMNPFDFPGPAFADEWFDPDLLEQGVNMDVAHIGSQNAPTQQ